MDKILVAGIDTTIGANLAAWLAGRFQVNGLSWGERIAIAGCETSVCDPAAHDLAQQWIARERPQWVVYCGPASRSCWTDAASAIKPDAVQAAGAWAAAAKTHGCEFTLISSDGVFTGPWMFHKENGACFSESNPARLLRMIENEVATACPDSLIVRTNLFGWAPTAASSGLVESILDCVQDGRSLSLDCMRHGTPLLATDLVDVLEKAYEHRLHGMFHIGGAERVNPFRFACLLADTFGYSAACLDAVETASEMRKDFGCGETSLQTRRIRKALDLPLPLIREGLARLYEQSVSGYRDRFTADSRIKVRVA